MKTTQMKKLFDEIPVLEDDRLLLRELEDADAAALGEMARSESVYRYLPTFYMSRNTTIRKP